MFYDRDLEICIPVHITTRVVSQLSQSFGFIM